MCFEYFHRVATGTMYLSYNQHFEEKKAWTIHIYGKGGARSHSQTGTEKCSEFELFCLVWQWKFCYTNVANMNTKQFFTSEVFSEITRSNTNKHQ